MACLLPAADQYAAPSTMILIVSQASTLGMRAGSVRAPPRSSVIVSVPCTGRSGARHAVANAGFASTPVLMALVSAHGSSSVIAGTGRTDTTPTPRPAEGGEDQRADMGEEDGQAAAAVSVTARRVLPGALAERCVHVGVVSVHLDIGCVCMNFSLPDEPTQVHGGVALAKKKVIVLMAGGRRRVRQQEQDGQKELITEEKRIRT
jgi:hypothetical protein